jgi:Protein of unknown function (DUF4031)
MTVYVDDCRLSWNGKRWCHMVADTVEELHEFARLLGLKRGWFQERTMYPHYDITLGVRERALSMGAQFGDKIAIISCAKKLRLELIEVRRATAAAKPEFSA